MEHLKESMLNLIQVLDKYPPPELSSTLESYGFRRIPIKRGKLRYSAEPMDIHVDKRLHISPELDFFYRHCEIICDTCDVEDVPDFMSNPGSVGIMVGEFLALSHPEKELAEIQWSGYYPSWNPCWLVVALNMSSDAVIVDTGKEKSPVMVASHDNGVPYLVANSFAEFLDYLSILIELEHGKYNGNKRDKETYDYVDGFLDDVREGLSRANCNSMQVENFINYIYGEYEFIGI